MKQRWPVFLLAALLSLVAAAIVIRTSMIQSLIQRPDVVERFAPGHPRVLTGRVEQELRLKGGQVTPQMRALAGRALRAAPMAEEPLLVAGIDALIAKDEAKARELLSHALARNPRSELARLLMLELDLRAKDARRAVADMTILGRLMPDVQKVFVPELARMALDPRTGSTLAATLRGDPPMLAKVLRHLAENGASPRLLLQMAGGVPTQAMPEEVEDWREPLLRAMVARGDAQGAHRLWAAFAGGAASRTEAVYDEMFKGLPGLPPFNWALHASEIGAAEKQKDGGLQVEYYGREPGDLATQLITLTPGRYRLGFRAEGDIQDPQHRLIWQISCFRADKAASPPLAELPIANLTFSGRTIAGDFTVPANCPAQWLKLIGRPTEFPKNESVTVRRIRIERLPGAA